MNFRYAVTAGHLLLVACGAAGMFPGPNGGWPGNALRWYGALSGSDNGYGFFAPGVSSQLRVRFTLSDEIGRSWNDTFDQGSGRETSLRVGSMVSTAAQPEWRRDLAASWAAKMFGCHPDASQVVVRIEEEDLPSLKQFQAGKRPEWHIAYEAAFKRSHKQHVTRGK